MRIFDKDYKYNFIDENDVLVGYDNSQSCCEDFGYHFTESVPSDIEVAIPDLENYKFDTEFFQEVSDEGSRYEAYFKITDGTNVRFLCIYNSHNGYYSHGFSFSNKEKVIREGAL